MPKKKISRLEKKIVRALVMQIEANPGVETKLLRGYLALRLMTENGHLPYGGNDLLTKLPTPKQIITILKRSRRVRWTKPGPYWICWYAARKAAARRKSADVPGFPVAVPTPVS